MLNIESKQVKNFCCRISDACYLSHMFAGMRKRPLFDQVGNACNFIGSCLKFEYRNIFLLLVLSVSFTFRQLKINTKFHRSKPANGLQDFQRRVWKAV